MAASAAVKAKAKAKPLQFVSQPHDPHAQSEHADASDILSSIPAGFPQCHTLTHTNEGIILDSAKFATMTTGKNIGRSLCR